jgi:hypothetical protein
MKTRELRNPLRQAGIRLRRNKIDVNNSRSKPASQQGIAWWLPAPT